MQSPRNDDHPLLSRIRERRRELGLSLRALARAARIGSGAYVLHLENGDKAPSETVAIRLARALGEGEEQFAHWARCLESRDLGQVLRSARELLADPALAAFADGLWRPPPEPTGPWATGTLRLRVPIVAAGDDPGDGVRPACPVLGHVSLGRNVMLDDEFERPFAWVLDAAHTARVPDLAAGRLAVFSRAAGPIDPYRVHAVRAGEGLRLARVTWNGRALLLHAAPGAQDFDVLAAPDAAAVRHQVVGFVARVLDPARAGDALRLRDVRP